MSSEKKIAMYGGTEALYNAVSYPIKFFQGMAIPGPSPMMAGFYHLKDMSRQTSQLLGSTAKRKRNI